MFWYCYSCAAAQLSCLFTCVLLIYSWCFTRNTLMIKTQCSCGIRKRKRLTNTSSPRPPIISSLMHLWGNWMLYVDYSCGALVGGWQCTYDASFSRIFVSQIPKNIEYRFDLHVKPSSSRLLAPIKMKPPHGWGCYSLCLYWVWLTVNCWKSFWNLIMGHLYFFKSQDLLFLEN